MTVATERLVPVGTAVTIAGGAPGKIIAAEIINREEDDDAIPFEVYEVEQTKDHVGAGDRVTFEGQRYLLYRSGFTISEEFDLKVTYEFRARVKGDDEVQAREAFITALVDALTFDGDDDAPEPLVELQMRRVS